jgi:hypothetical protein
MSGRATNTRSSPSPSRRGSCRNPSRRQRRIRFRTTADPSFRLTARPRRSASPPLGSAITRKNRPPTRVPRRKTRSKSERTRKRRSRPKPDSMTPSGPARSDGQPLPALLPPPLQDHPATLRPHPDQKAVGSLSLPIVGLIRPLHGGFPSLPLVPRRPSHQDKLKSLQERGSPCQSGRPSSSCTVRLLHASVTGLRTAQLQSPSHETPSRFSTTVEISV